MREPANAVVPLVTESAPDFGPWYPPQVAKASSARHGCFNGVSWVVTILSKHGKKKVIMPLAIDLQVSARAAFGG